MSRRGGRRPPPPPASGEVERARERLLKDWELTMRNSERAALELSEWAAMGDWRLMFLERDRLRNVTPADVQRVAAAYLRPSNRTVGLYIPTREADRTPVPPAPDVAAMVKGYRGGEGLAIGENFEATPENIEATIRRTTLPSGLKLVLLPKKTRGGTVNLSLSLHFGDEKSPEPGAGRDLAGGMLMRGTAKRSQDDRLPARGSSSSVGDQPAPASDARDHRGGAPAQAEILEQPASPRRSSSLKQEILTARGVEERAYQLAYTARERHEAWPSADALHRHAGGAIVMVKRVTDQAKGFLPPLWRLGRRAGAGRDFDPAEWEVAAELFGSWTSLSPPAWQRLAARPLPARRRKHRKGAVFRAGLPIELRRRSGSAPSPETLGRGFLSSRLATRPARRKG
jgi:zinc protease